jgi:hypothetical protein
MKQLKCPNCGRVYRCKTCGRPYKDAKEAAQCATAKLPQKECENCKANFSIAVSAAIKKLAHRS